VSPCKAESLADTILLLSVSLLLYTTNMHKEDTLGTQISVDQTAVDSVSKALCDRGSLETHPPTATVHMHTTAVSCNSHVHLNENTQHTVCYQSAKMYKVSFNISMTSCTQPVCCFVQHLVTFPANHICCFIAINITALLYSFWVLKHYWVL